MNQIVHCSFDSNQSIRTGTEGIVINERENQKWQFECKQFATFH